MGQTSLIRNVAKIVHELRPRGVFDWLSVFSKVIRHERRNVRDEVRRLFVEIFGFEPDEIDVYGEDVFARKYVKVKAKVCREVIGEKDVEGCHLEFILQSVNEHEEETDWVFMEEGDLLKLHKIFTVNGKKFRAAVLLTVVRPIAITY